MHSNWDRVIGQDRVKRILRTAIRHRRVAHAVLLWGPEGAGKEALAIEFAAVLLCRTQSDTACGVCPSCKKMSLLQHPNVKLIFPLPGSDQGKNDDGEPVEGEVVEEIRKQTAAKAENPYLPIQIPKAKVIRIKSIREIKKESSLSSAEAGKKIFILFEADALNDEAANALLKVLEEPLPDVHFILVTSRKDALKQTIISRCQPIQCSLLSDDEIASALVQRHGLPADQAVVAARLSDGNFRRAFDIVHSDLHRYRNDAVLFLRSILGPSPVRMFDEQDEYFTGNKRENAEQLLTMLLAWFRDSIVLREGSRHNVLNADQEADLTRFIDRFGTKDLEYCLTSVERALELLRRNVYLPLVMLSLSVQLRKTLHAG